VPVSGWRTGFLNVLAKEHGSGGAPPLGGAPILWIVVSNGFLLW
jgi:hypothetical protein